MKPIRFVLPVCEHGERWAWRIFVRKGDVQPTQSLAAAGNLITEATVRGWFQQFASRWPEPPDGVQLTTFVLALNVLRVTRSKSVAELQNQTRKHAETAKRIAKIKSAIDILVNDLEPMLVAAALKISIPYSNDQILNLVRLVQAAKDAQGIIVAPKPPHKETPWHEMARLIEWHLHQLLAPLRGSKPGNDLKGPLVRVVKAAIAAVGHLNVSEDAISKALQRSASASSAAETVEWAESKGYVAVG